MKIKIKNQLSKWGLLPYIEFGRHFPRIFMWLRDGCSGIAPPEIKRLAILSYQKKFDLWNFIETGTYYGDSLAYIANNKSISCTSIELSDYYHQLAIKRFRSYPNVTLLQGDSGKILPVVVGNLQTPTLFWLDGHYSGGLTAKGEIDTPISAELQSILDSPILNHVILIDDARYFNGTDNYPHLDDLLKTIRQNGKYECEIATDIIRITPKN
jgi:hypothetical protein